MPKRSREYDPYARNYAMGAGERRQRRVVNTAQRLRASNSLRPITNPDMLKMYYDYRNGNEDQRQQIKNNYTGAFVLPQLNQRGIPMDVINEQIGGFLGLTFNPNNNRLEDQNGTRLSRREGIRVAADVMRRDIDPDLPLISAPQTYEQYMERYRRRVRVARDKLDARKREVEAASLPTRRLDEGPHREDDVSVRLEKEYNPNNPSGSRDVTYMRVLPASKLAAVRRGEKKYLSPYQFSLLEKNNVPNDVEQGLRFLASEGNSFVRDNNNLDFINKMMENTHRSMHSTIGTEEKYPSLRSIENQYLFDYKNAYPHHYPLNDDYLEIGTAVDRVLPRTSLNSVSRRLPALYTPVAQVGQQEPRQNALDLFHTLAAQRRHLRN
jgi:hypothetical protein